MQDSTGRKDEDDAKVTKVEDGEEIREDDGDGGDKVKFGSQTHGFTPHPSAISLTSHQTPIVGKKEEL